jgi:Lrp/AsnC family transcriptional regulator
MKLDAIDRRILLALQDNADISIAQLADRAGLSQTPCWKRVQKLEEAGIINRRVALLTPEKLGLGLTVFVQVEAGDHSADWLQNFASTV